MKLVLLKRVIRWIYDSAKVIDKNDPSYAQKRLGVKESLKVYQIDGKGLIHYHQKLMKNTLFDLFFS